VDQSYKCSREWREESFLRHSVRMYVNGKMRPVESVPGMGVEIKDNGGV
jgi:hypothetical protein